MMANAFSDSSMMELNERVDWNRGLEEPGIRKYRETLCQRSMFNGGVESPTIRNSVILT